jgi:dTDP-4-amino-4,6-dideoxygalactose transaminase
LIPVHLYGQPADMAAIGAVAAARRITLVEDCAQAHLARDKGRPVGTAGAFGCFSFYPGKNLGAWGEAGAVVCNDAEFYRKARMIRRHGEIERYHHEVVGHNYRMEAFQGAVLGTKLKYLEGWTAGRRRNAALYTELLAEVEEVETPKIRPGAEPVFHLYVIQAERRDELQKFLSEKGIATGLHYPVPLHLQPAYRHLGYKAGDFPVAERAAKRILSLPMYPELEEGQIRYVVEAIKDFWSAKK